MVACKKGMGLVAVRLLADIVCVLLCRSKVKMHDKAFGGIRGVGAVARGL
jgi:hypothetical protein